jgi:hypothetical protein
MRIFVGYAFRDTWVEEYVIPLIETYGVTVETGKEVPGERIDQGIKDKINRADAVVVFLTRVEQLPNPQAFKPSDWVVQELTIAANRNPAPLILDVREAGVEFGGGLQGNLQRYKVDPADLAPFLVKLGRAVSSWRGAGERKLQLVSELDAFAKANRAFINRGDYQCSYQVRRNTKLIEDVKDVEIVRERSGLFIQTKPMPPDVLISVTVRCNNEVWSSPGMAVDILDVRIEKD